MKTIIAACFIVLLGLCAAQPAQRSGGFNPAMMSMLAGEGMEAQDAMMFAQLNRMNAARAGPGGRNTGRSALQNWLMWDLMDLTSSDMMGTMALMGSLGRRGSGGSAIGKK